MDLTAEAKKSASREISPEVALDKLKRVVKCHTAPDVVYDGVVAGVGEKLLRLVDRNPLMSKLAIFVFKSAAAKLNHGSSARDPEGFTLAGQFDDFLEEGVAYPDTLNSEKAHSFFTLSIGGRGKPVSEIKMPKNDAPYVHAIQGLMKLTQGQADRSRYSYLVSSKPVSKANPRYNKS